MMRWLFKSIKWLAILLLLLMLLSMAISYYLLNTNEGLKRAISLANKYSGYSVSADAIEGNLLSRTELKNLYIKGDNLDFTSERILLDWQSSALWDKSLIVKSIAVDNATITLMPMAEDEEEKIDQPMSLSDIDLPIDIALEDLQINNLTLKNPVIDSAKIENTASDIVIDKIHLGVHYVGQTAVIDKLLFEGLDTHLNLTGEVLTKGSFPLKLSSSTQYKNKALGREIINLAIDGALKDKLDFSIDGEGLTHFNVNGQLKGLFETPVFEAQVRLEKINTKAFGMTDAQLNANLFIEGQAGKDIAINTTGDVFYQSPQTDKLKLNLVADFDGQLVSFSQLTLDLLATQQQLQGSGQYHLTDKTIDVNFHSDFLHWPQQSEKAAVSLSDLLLKVAGKLDNYQLSAKTTAQADAVGEVPLAIEATGDLSSIKQFKAIANIDQKPISIIGDATWAPALRYRAEMTSPDRKPYRQFPGLKKLDLIVSGDDKAYQANGDVLVYSESIPPADIHLDIIGTPNNLDRVHLLVKLLGGEISIDASGALSPLALTANVDSKHIQPQMFYPNIKGDINHQIVINARQTGDDLSISALIKGLSGNLQGYPLSGKGKMDFNQATNRLDIEGLFVNLAGNKVEANGHLALDMAAEQSNVRANIDAPALKRLLPDLTGSAKAKIHATGQLDKPEVQADITVKDFAYQTHRASNIHAKANVSMAGDKLNIAADVKEIKTGENVIHSGKLAIQGAFSNHQLRVDMTTPKQATIPSVTLTGKGGLNLDTMVWKGQLTTLDLSNEILGKWHLANPTALTLSADNIRVAKFCLAQNPTQLCADGALKGKNGNFNVALKSLSTKRFANRMPDSVGVNTVLSGKAKIRLKNGKPNVEGKLIANSGQLKIKAGKGELTSKIQQFETAFILKNNRLDSLTKSRFSQLGKIDIKAKIPNLSQRNLTASVKIDNKSLKFIERLVPQLTDVNGGLSGDMTLSGNPQKSLNMTGKITLHQTDFNVPQFGSEIRSLTLDIFSKNGNRLGFNGAAKAGKGNFHISGEINPSTQHGTINLKGKQFQVADSRKLSVAISPDLKIILDKKIKVRGEVAVPKALIIPESTGSKVTVSEDVILPNRQKKKKAAASPIDVEVKVTLGDDVRVASADIETRLTGGIRVSAKPGKAPKGTGAIEVETGELRIYGQMLNIERGRVIFGNGPIANPSLDIRTSRDINDGEIIVGANVLGTVVKPEISLFSRPSMADASILSYLLFGRPPNSDSFGTAALLQTGGMIGANTLARDLRSSLGLDVLDFSLTGMEAGKHFSKKLYLGMRSNFFEALNAFFLDYKINPHLRVEGVASSEEMSVDLIRVLETD